MSARERVAARKRAYNKGGRSFLPDLVNMCPKRCYFVDRLILDSTVARVWKNDITCKNNRLGTCYFFRSVQFH